MSDVVSPISRGQGHEFLNKLEAAGLTSNIAQRVIDSKGNNLAAKVVRFIDNGGFEPTASQKRARKIMGRNMFGIEEAITYFGVNPSLQQLAVLSEIPFGKETLEACKDTHVLVAVFPLSILEIMGEIAQDLCLFRDRNDQSLYKNQEFAKEKGETEWQLVRKTSIENSASRTWDEQLVLLSDKEQVPKARVVVYTMIGHFLATGERLFEIGYVRCSDEKEFLFNSYRVSVGSFNSSGLYIWINYYWDEQRFPCLGIVSARKFE